MKKINKMSKQEQAPKPPPPSVGSLLAKYVQKVPKQFLQIDGLERYLLH